MEYLKKIISGGQTGVDQAALEAAIYCNIEYGGFCPKGFICEAGIIPKKYRLSEIKTTSYSSRTKRNIEESDGTLILITQTPLKGGTKLTQKYAFSLEKPVLVQNIMSQIDYSRIFKWINENQITILNIAGPRESNFPGIFQLTKNWCTKLFNQYHNS